MKIAFSAEGSDLNATVDPRFGRCKQFVIVDSNDLTFEVLRNSGQDAESSAGISAAQALVQRSIDAAASGHVGPKAQQVLEAAGIRIYENVSGTIREAVQSVLNGTVQSAAGHSEPDSSVPISSQHKAGLRIAVSVEDDKGLDSTVSAHFGRCPHYLFADVAEGRIRAFRVAANPFFNDHGQPGQVPAFIRQQKADVMIAGDMGPRAIQFFEQFGIATATGAAGKAGAVIEAYLAGSLESGAPCHHEHEHGHEHGCHDDDRGSS
jgi:predicted Fe-Mo cluster-binding NifX family protein